MLVTYAHELSYGELVTFLERALSKRLGTHVLVKMEGIKDQGNCREVNFKLLTTNSTMLCNAKFSNYECVVTSGDKNLGTVNFKKEWAKYVCEVLDSKKLIGTINSVTSHQYRADYNDFWTRIKNEKIQQANDEFDQTKLSF